MLNLPNQLTALISNLAAVADDAAASSYEYAAGIQHARRMAIDAVALGLAEMEQAQQKRCEIEDEMLASIRAASRELDRISKREPAAAVKSVRAA